MIAQVDPGNGKNPPPLEPPPAGRIRSLANVIRALRDDNGKKFVLMLGAGASVSSGVKTSSQIINDLLEAYADGLTGTPDERFDKLWRRTPPNQRRAFLTPLLADHRPSVGYQRLATLIQLGYFDLVMTFNYDRLLERALEEAGVPNDRIKIIIRGETELDQIAGLVEERAAEFTLLKLHGSLQSTDYFLYDQAEMSEYPKALDDLVSRLTARDIMVCGYGFNDDCMRKAFSRRGNSVVSVNLKGVPSSLRGIQYKRSSQDWDLKDLEGDFDNFFSALADELLRPAEKRQRVEVLNPFKFLAAYEEGNKQWFFGRTRLRREVLGRLEQESRPVIHLIGPPKSGKTSFVRAGLIAHLDPSSHPIYVRCRTDLVKQLSDHASLPRPQAPSSALPAVQATLLALRDAAAKPVTLVLDQFERVMSGTSGKPAEWGSLRILFDELCAAATSDMRIVFVAAESEQTPYYKLIVASKLPRERKNLVFESTIFEVEPLTPKRIAILIDLLLKKTGLTFDPQIREALIARLGTERSGVPAFSLAHIQALCYLLVSANCTTWEHFQNLLYLRPQLEDDLHRAITEYDILNFLEDFPTKSEGRLVRSCMQVVPDRGKSEIAKLIKGRFADLMRDPEFPETIHVI